MVDSVSSQKRSEIMAAVKHKDTRPEMIVRRYLHSHGFRYRLHSKTLPGHPDIVLKKYKLVIFVNGCFWHGHKGCKFSRLPKSNVKFWKDKIIRNSKRDKSVTMKIEKLGWRVFTVWECQLKDNEALSSLEKQIRDADFDN